MGKTRKQNKNKQVRKYSNVTRRTIVHSAASRSNQMKFTPSASVPVYRALDVFTAQQFEHMPGNMRHRFHSSRRHCLLPQTMDQLSLEVDDNLNALETLEQCDTSSDITTNTQSNALEPSGTMYPVRQEVPAKQSDPNKRRFVIIDGSNVAFAHSLGREFSVRGLQICINFINDMGHDAKAVVPLFRKYPGKSTDPQLLEELHSAGKVVFSPCKNLLGKIKNSHDDRLVLQLASRTEGVVLTNDNYSELIDESPEFREIIERRVLTYAWCDDVLVLVKDPYGRNGPTLDNILTRN